jgi:mutator protein MutT
VGVGAVVLHEGRVLLIRRGKEPLRGRWLIPGGTVELGETLEQAIVREVREETGIVVRPREVVLVFDRIHREAGEVRYHYVVIDYLCEYLSGEPHAGSDAEAAAFVPEAELPGYDIPDQALELLRNAFAAARVDATRQLK